jgi:hypothetical protein
MIRIVYALLCALAAIVCFRIAIADRIRKRWFGFPVYMIAMFGGAIAFIGFAINIAELEKALFH